MPAPAVVIGAVVGALAELPGAVKGFVNSITSFIQDLNPAAVVAMNEALRSLNATVGFALEPILIGFTQIVRDLAGELYEPMNNLRNVVGQLVSHAVGVVRPFLGTFGVLLGNAVSNLTAFMPVVEIVIAALEGVANIVNVVLRTISTIVTYAQGYLLGQMGDLSGAVNAVRDSMLQATIAVLKFNDSILRGVGLNELADRLAKEAIAAAEPKQGRAPAITNVQVTDLQAIYRSRLQAAASATR